MERKIVSRSSVVAAARQKRWERTCDDREGCTELESNLSCKILVVLAIITRRCSSSTREKSSFIPTLVIRLKLESYLSVLFAALLHTAHTGLTLVVGACNKYVSTSKSILRAFISQTSRAKDVKCTMRERTRCAEDAWNPNSVSNFFSLFAASNFQLSWKWQSKLIAENWAWSSAAPASRTLETIGDLNLFTPNPTTVRASTPQYVTWFIDLDSWVCKADDLE